MWLEPEITRHRVGGTVFAAVAAVAALPELETLSTMMPGSMPAESEALSSSARLRTTIEVALQHSGGARARHNLLDVKDQFLIRG